MLVTALATRREHAFVFSISVFGSTGTATEVTLQSADPIPREIGPEWNLSILNLSLLIGSKVPEINEERLDEISLALLYPATAG
jgi:hypothetical protein